MPDRIFRSAFVALACVGTLAGCDQTGGTVTPEGDKIVAMTESGPNFSILKQKPDGSLVLCFYSNYDDKQPLTKAGCAPVPQ
jgi:predicted small lipoprotein YifL